MALTIEIDFGSGLTNISEHCQDLKRSRRLHKDLKPTINTARWVVHDINTANLFNVTTSTMPVRIQKDAVDWFVGQVRPTYKNAVGASLKAFNVEAIDNSIDLKKKIDESFSYTNFTVSNPATTSQSILHQLFLKAGFALADLTFPTISKTISRYTVERQDEKTFWNEASELLFEFGYVFDVGPDGKVSLHHLHPTALTTSALTDDDMYQPLSIKRQELRHEAVRVDWNPVTTLAGVLVFSDKTGGDDTNPCNIPLALNEWYPDTADTEVVYSLFKVEDGELLAVDSPVLTWTKTGSVSLQRAVYSPKRADIAFKGDSGGGTITRFEVRGDAVIKDKTKLNRSVVYRVVGTDKIRQIKSRFLETRADGNQLASDIANWLDFSRFLYEFDVNHDFTVNLADELALNEGVMSITTDVRVIELTEDDFGNRHAICEGVSAYSALTTENQDTIESPDASTAARDDEPRLVTKVEDQSGYEDAGSGGTLIPTVPAAVASSQHRIITVTWNKQNNLTNFDRYEIQVSDDDATWHALRDDGVDWKGTLGADTDVSDESRDHMAIPLGGTEDDPTDLTLFYRVRSVTKAGAQSAYSTVVSATAKSVVSGDLKLNVVTEQKLADLAVALSKLKTGETIDLLGGTGREEMVLNGDFEAGGSFWQENGSAKSIETGGGANVYRGDKSYKLAKTGAGNVDAYQIADARATGGNLPYHYVRVQPGDQLRQRVAYKTNGTQAARYGIREYDENKAHITWQIDQLAATASFVEDEQVWTLGATTYYVVQFLSTNTDAPTNTVFFDEVHCWRIKSAADLGPASVTTVKVADGALTHPKFSTGAIVLGREPTIIVARKASQDGGAPPATNRLTVLGYSVTENLTATVADCRAYDIVVVDSNAWDADQHDTFINDLATDGQRIWVSGNDSKSGLFYTTSAVSSSPVGTVVPDGRVHPISSGWSSIVDSDGGWRITGIEVFARQLGAFSDNAAHISLIEASHPSGGYVFHMQHRFGVTGTDADRLLKNAVDWLIGNSVRASIGQVEAAFIGASAVVAGKIAANAVTATEIAAGTITAAEIAADTITANQMAANSIGTSELIASAVTAAKIAALAITTNKLAAGAVTTDKVSTAVLNTLIATIREFVMIGAGTGLTGFIGKIEVFTITTVADVAGSLGGKRIEFGAPTGDFYAWFDVDNGSTDPAIASKVGIEVDIATGATANAVASALQAAVNARTEFSAGVSTNVVTVTCAKQGTASDVAAIDSGMAVAVTTQGSDADTPADGDIRVYIDGDEMRCEERVSGAWVTIFQLGGQDGDGLLHRLFRSGGLRTATAANLKDEAPDADCMLFDFERATVATAVLYDQYGDHIGGAGNNLTISTTTVKFGSQSIRLSGTTPCRVTVQHPIRFMGNANGLAANAMPVIDGTMSAWVRFANVSTTHDVCAFGANNSNNKVTLSKAGATLQALVNENNATPTTVFSHGTTIVINTWYHVAFSYEAAAKRATIVVDATATNGTVSTGPLNFDNPFKRWGHSGSGVAMDMFLDDALERFDAKVADADMIRHYDRNLPWGPIPESSIGLAHDAASSIIERNEHANQPLRQLSYGDMPSSSRGSGVRVMLEESARKVIVSSASGGLFLNTQQLTRRADHPYGVRGLYVSVSHAFTGDGTSDQKIFHTRHPDSTAGPTLATELSRVQFTNLGSGITLSRVHQATVRCNSMGQFRWGYQAGFVGSQVDMWLWGYE